MSGDHITAWMPETDQHRLAVLGKLIEECNELAGRAARCIIQGLDAIDPDSGRLNWEELAREIADVNACIWQVSDRFAIGPDDLRVAAKHAGFDRWHDLIDATNAERAR